MGLCLSTPRDLVNGEDPARKSLHVAETGGAISGDHVPFHKAVDTSDEHMALNLTAVSPKQDALAPNPGPGRQLQQTGSPSTPPTEVPHVLLPPDAPPPPTRPVWQSPFSSQTYQDEPERTAALRSLGELWNPPDDRFDHITKLMSTIFQVPASTITLIDDERVNLRSVAGPTHWPNGAPRMEGFCEFVLVPSQPVAHIVEDTAADARYAGHGVVLQPPHMRFYAGAPLVGTGGRRYGTLCVVDTRPRRFPAELYNTLINFADLVVRELERGKPPGTAGRVTSGSIGKLPNGTALVGSVPANSAPGTASTATPPGTTSTQQWDAPRWDVARRDAVALVDASDPARWVIKYVNDCWVQVQGGDFSDWLDAALQDRFDITVPGARAVAAGVCDGIDADDASGAGINPGSGFDSNRRPAPTPAEELGRGKTFCVELVTAGRGGCKHAAAGLTTQPGSQAAGTPSGPRFRASVRPSGTDRLLDSSCTGIPAFLCGPADAGRSGSGEPVAPRGSRVAASRQVPLWFVVLDPAPSTKPGFDAAVAPDPATPGPARGWEDPASLRRMPAPLRGRLELNLLLGSGSYGRVYRGLLDGRRTVAVKVLPHGTRRAPSGDESAADDLPDVALEVEVGCRLRHPNIVRTYKHAWRGACDDVDDDGQGSVREVVRATSDFNDGPQASETTSSRPAAPMAPPLHTPQLATGSADAPENAASSNVLLAFSHKTDNNMKNAPDAEGVTWLVMEYCDAGTLYEAIDRGWLLRSCDGFSPADWVSVLLTIAEIADAVACMHAAGIVHSDLSGANILLVTPGELRRRQRRRRAGGSGEGTTNPKEGEGDDEGVLYDDDDDSSAALLLDTADRRPFRAKVADFGMARRVTPDAALHGVNMYGTVSHMPPELLGEGELCQGADVYSLGVLLFELSAGRRAWKGMRPPQILHTVATLGRSLVDTLPEFPGPAAAGVRDLMRACLRRDAGERPSAAGVAAAARRLLAEWAARGGDGGPAAPRVAALPDPGDVQRNPAPAFCLNWKTPSLGKLAVQLEAEDFDEMTPKTPT